MNSALINSKDSIPMLTWWCKKIYLRKEKAKELI